MPRLSNKEKLAAIHAEALTRFNSIQQALKHERDQCAEDRRFYSISGAQWDGDLGKQFANRPRFEVNKVHLAVIRLINEYRNNRITVDFVAKDGGEDHMSDVCDGRYRADEKDSCAEEAYDNAFEEAVAGGIGAWRLRTVFEDEEDDDNDHQRIRIEPIYDADKSVYFDLNAKRQDKSDAKYAYVIYSLTPEEYKEKYNEDPFSWPKDDELTQFDWVKPDMVYLSEYYRIEQQRHTIRIFKQLDGSEERFSEGDLDDEKLRVLSAIGARELEPKTVLRNRIRKYLLNGNHILEDMGYIAGSNIPIVPVYGKRWFIANIERCMGHVRLSKDAQRLKNMQLSKLAEISALSPIEKPIFTDDQIIGHTDEWSFDNIENYPYLTVNAVDDGTGAKRPMGPVGYTRPPQVPPAMAALLGITEQDIKDLLGNQEAGEEMMPNISGKAVELIQNKLDMQSYIYISNMKKAVKRCGEIWLSMAREIYVEEGRRLKLLGRQNEIESVELMEPRYNETTGQLEYKNDFAKANFDVDVEVGPSTSSKRAAIVRQLTGMLQMVRDPETTALISSLAMMNMEGEGLSEVRQYFRKKLIRMGVIEPNEEEARELAAELEQLQQQRQNAEQQYLQALSAESMAKAEKAKADTVYTVARAKETEAKTAETLSDMDVKRQKQTLETMKAIRETQNIPVTATPE